MKTDDDGGEGVAGFACGAGGAGVNLIAALGCGIMLVGMSAEDRKPKSQLEALRERQAKESPIDQGPNPEARVEQFRRQTAHLVDRNRRDAGR